MLLFARFTTSLSSVLLQAAALLPLLLLLFSSSRSAVVSAATTCSNVDDTSSCAYEPINPVTCGPTHSECHYENFCLAEVRGCVLPCAVYSYLLFFLSMHEANHKSKLASSASSYSFGPELSIEQLNGHSVDADCCQAPSPSACPFLYQPVVCGNKKCVYDNDCIAELAGYTASSQCQTYEPPSSTCPVPSGSDPCTANIEPVKCGPNYECTYDKYVLRETDILAPRDRRNSLLTINSRTTYFFYLFFLNQAFASRRAPATWTATAARTSPRTSRSAARRTSRQSIAGRRNAPTPISARPVRLLRLCVFVGR